MQCFGSGDQTELISKASGAILLFIIFFKIIYFSQS